MFMTAEQDTFITKHYLEKRKFLLEYADSSLHNYALAEEAVQQTFEIACYKINDFYNSPNPGGWLTKTLSFVIRNIQSRQRTERKVIAFTDDYRPDLVAAPESPTPLRMTYGSLVDTPQFRLLYETEILGHTLAEIAEELDISEAACKKRAERARTFLQKKLRK
jgi:RNA polymerase sigma-70 factor (ECF subfamily)